METKSAKTKKKKVQIAISSRDLKQYYSAFFMTLYKVLTLKQREKKKKKLIQEMWSLTEADKRIVTGS